MTNKIAMCSKDIADQARSRPIGCKLNGRKSNSSASVAQVRSRKPSGNRSSVSRATRTGRSRTETKSILERNAHVQERWRDGSISGQWRKPAIDHRLHVWARPWCAGDELQVGRPVLEISRVLRRVDEIGGVSATAEGNGGIRLDHAAIIWIGQPDLARDRENREIGMEWVTIESKLLEVGDAVFLDVQFRSGVGSIESRELARPSRVVRG